MKKSDGAFDAPRKARRRSLALLLLGVGVLLPPIAGISLVDAKIAGVPLPLLYVFVVWALLITGTALLARPLRDGDQTVKPNEDGPTIT